MPILLCGAVTLPVLALEQPEQTLLLIICHIIILSPDYSIDFQQLVTANLCQGHIVTSLKVLDVHFILPVNYY